MNLHQKLRYHIFRTAQLTDKVRLVYLERSNAVVSHAA